MVAVKYNNTQSNFKKLKIGLTQGAVSSTTLFNVCMNYLCKRLKKIPGLNCAVYADDVVFWTLVKNNKKDHQLLESKISKAL